MHKNWAVTGVLTVYSLRRHNPPLEISVFSAFEWRPLEANMVTVRIPHPKLGYKERANFWIRYGQPIFTKIGAHRTDIVSVETQDRIAVSTSTAPIFVIG